jgi:hypothetical protein
MDVPAAWKEHQGERFPPGLLGRSLDGVPLVRIDAVAGAALTAGLGRDGIPRPLEPKRRASLESQLPLIDAVLADPALEGDGRRYFERLKGLAAALLKA